MPEDSLVSLVDEMEALFWEAEGGQSDRRQLLSSAMAVGEAVQEADLTPVERMVLRGRMRWYLRQTLQLNWDRGAPSRGGDLDLQVEDVLNDALGPIRGTQGGAEERREASRLLEEIVRTRRARSEDEARIARRAAADRVARRAQRTPQQEIGLLADAMDAVWAVEDELFDLPPRNATSRFLREAPGWIDDARDRGLRGHHLDILQDYIREAAEPFMSTPEERRALDSSVPAGPRGRLQQQVTLSLRGDQHLNIPRPGYAREYLTVDDAVQAELRRRNSAAQRGFRTWSGPIGVSSETMNTPAVQGEAPSIGGLEPELQEAIGRNPEAAAFSSQFTRMNPNGQRFFAGLLEMTVPERGDATSRVWVGDIPGYGPIPVVKTSISPQGGDRVYLGLLQNIGPAEAVNAGGAGAALRALSELADQEQITVGGHPGAFETASGREGLRTGNPGDGAKRPSELPGGKPSLYWLYERLGYDPDTGERAPRPLRAPPAQLSFEEVGGIPGRVAWNRGRLLDAALHVKRQKRARAESALGELVRKADAFARERKLIEDRYARLERMEPQARARYEAAEKSLRGTQLDLLDWEPPEPTGVARRGGEVAAGGRRVSPEGWLAEARVRGAATRARDAILKKSPEMARSPSVLRAALEGDELMSASHLAREAGQQSSADFLAKEASKKFRSLERLAGFRRGARVAGTALNIAAIPLIALDAWEMGTQIQEEGPAATGRQIAEGAEQTGRALGRTVLNRPTEELLGLREPGGEVRPGTLRGNREREEFIERQTQEFMRTQGWPEERARKQAGRMFARIDHSGQPLSREEKEELRTEVPLTTLEPLPKRPTPAGYQDRMDRLLGTTPSTTPTPSPAQLRQDAARRALRRGEEEEPPTPRGRWEP